MSVHIISLIFRRLLNANMRSIYKSKNAGEVCELIELGFDCSLLSRPGMQINFEYTDCSPRATALIYLQAEGWLT